jgi:hypothetical protein
MTLDERELLQKFLHDLIQVRVPHKDPVAEALIVQACTRQPDALYILVQRLMIAQHALDRLSNSSAKDQSPPPSAGTTPSQQFLNPGLIASTALGVAAGSLLQQGLSGWLESEDLAGLSGLDDIDL